MNPKPKRKKLPMNLAEHRGFGKYDKATDLGPLVTGDNLGIEIELENIKGAIDSEGRAKIVAPVGWEIHRDGSLRNNGAEFVFKHPAGGKEVFDRLMRLEDWFKVHKMKPDPSPRTSVHVHIDAGDTNTGQLLKWILLYTVFEPLLFAEFAPDRENSNFCVPLYNAVDMKQAIGKLRGTKEGFAASSFNPFYDTIISQREQKRYAALNLDAIRKFGTLEFRHLGGEYKHGPILDWVNTLLGLKQWAMNDDNSVKDIFYGPSKVFAENLTYRVFGPREGSRFVRNINFKKLYFSGVRTAQEIYLHEGIPPVPVSLSEVIKEKLIKRKDAKLKGLKTQLSGMKELDTAGEIPHTRPILAESPEDDDLGFSDIPYDDEEYIEEYNEETDEFTRTPVPRRAATTQAAVADFERTESNSFERMLANINERQARAETLAQMNAQNQPPTQTGTQTVTVANPWNTVINWGEVPRFFNDAPPTGDSTATEPNATEIMRRQTIQPARLRNQPTRRRT